MAHGKDAIAALRASYVQGAALTTAATACGVPYATARNWKRGAEARGDDWDLARNAQRMTAGGMAAMTNEVLDGLAVEFLATLKLVKDDAKMSALQRSEVLVKLMDGYNKAISASSRAMPGANRLAVAMDVIQYLIALAADRAPKLRPALLDFVQASGEDIAREFGSRS